MFPDVGAGNPLSHIWWLSLIVLFICTVATSVIAVYLGNLLQRKNQADAAQTKEIAALQGKFQECRVNCANHRGSLVSRDDFEARMIRFEESIGKVYGICDQTNIKVGKIEGLIGRDLWLKPDSAGKNE